MKPKNGTDATLFLVRHGETTWSSSGQHTGRTDLPLTDQGVLDACRLKPFLSSISFEAVFSSPLQRALQTCEKAGFEEIALPDPDLQEWNYGEYEGLTTAQIREKNPHWNIFTDGAPNGESVQDVVFRAQNFLKKVEKSPGKILIFSHGHFLKILTTVFLKQSPQFGSHISLSTSSLSILGFDKKNPSILSWNLVDLNSFSKL